MNAPQAVAFRGADEEIEKYLLEFAGGVGGWAARDPKRGGWRVCAGSAFSTNPNTLRWRIRVSRDEGSLLLHSETWGWPWTRAKREHVGDYRRGQLADFLENRLRGGDPGRFDERRLRAPFTSFGSDPAALSASFAWSVAAGAAAVALAFAACTLAALAALNPAVDAVILRAGLIERAGGISLPNPAEIASIGWTFRLACAAVFAFPLAFSSGLLHTLALVAGEISTRAARLGLASFLFQIALLLFALWPLTPMAVPAALLVPLATHAGYTLVWGRRRERIREEGRPRPLIAGVGILLAIVIAMSFIPRPADGRDFGDRLALFRDRYLLGHPFGRALATLYYRTALYGTEPFKEFYAADPGHLQRLQRTARVDVPAAAPHFKALGFTVGDSESCDVRWNGALLKAGPHEIAWDGVDHEALKKALDELARKSFRGGSIREVAGLSWYAVYYAGPLAALLFAMGLFSPVISLLYRKLSRRAATLAILAILVLAVGGIAWDLSCRREVYESIATLREAPSPERIGAALEHGSPAVRHEGAYQAWRHPHPALLDALLRTAEDADLRVRLWSCGALGNMRDPLALRALINRLEDPEMFVRYRAAEALGRLGYRSAIDPLVRMVRERSWYEGDYALEALRRIEPSSH